MRLMARAKVLREMMSWTPERRVQIRFFSFSSS